MTGLSTTKADSVVDCSNQPAIWPQQRKLRTTKIRNHREFRIVVVRYGNYEELRFVVFRSSVVRVGLSIKYRGIFLAFSANLSTVAW
jgi:hypothetical protein